MESPQVLLILLAAVVQSETFKFHIPPGHGMAASRVRLKVADAARAPNAHTYSMSLSVVFSLVRSAPLLKFENEQPKLCNEGLAALWWQECSKQQWRLPVRLACCRCWRLSRDLFVPLPSSATAAVESLS